MTTKAISFLGYAAPGREYKDTTYCYGDQQWTTPFMAEATARFFAPDALLVLVTPEAKAQNYPDLAARLHGIVPVQAVDIPAARNEAELWQMFSIIADQIKPADEIIFDITNGYRSLPILAFLAGAYLQVARGATLRRMIYGAYDASSDGQTSVFDLTPFVRLLDWTTATDAFLKYGRADELATLVAAFPELAQLSASLGALTSALQTSRPTETGGAGGQSAAIA